MLVRRADQALYHHELTVSSLGSDCQSCTSPLAINDKLKWHKSFTSIQMLHTHTHTRPAAAGLFKAQTHEMKVKMKKIEMRLRWKWDDNYLTGTQEGERWKGTEKRKTPTPTHLAQNGQTLKGQGKRKSGRTTGQTPTRGGGADRSTWHNLQGESQSLPRHAKDPALT